MLTLLFFLILVLLVPVALYCLALALVNRRSHPVMVRGVWDCAGLLFAASGLLLFVGPTILNLLYARAVGELDLADKKFNEAIAHVWARWRVITVAYYTAMVVGVALVLWLRRDKTVIYNVDPDKFDTVLGQTLARLGLSAMRSGRQVRIVRRRPPADSDLPTDSFKATESNILSSSPYGRSSSSVEQEPGFFAAILEVDAFAPLANVTLHWRHWDDPQRSAMRREIEEELARNLDAAGRPDSPAVTWLLGIATALFGLLFLATLLLILLSPRRGL